MYSNANFNVEIEDLNKNLKSKVLMIKCNFNCYCYYKFPRISEYYLCKSDVILTNHDLICCLIENIFDPRCDHRSLISFDINSDVQVTAFLIHETF